jgi:hypothetical protein
MKRRTLAAARNIYIAALVDKMVTPSLIRDIAFEVNDTIALDGGWAVTIAEAREYLRDEIDSAVEDITYHMDDDLYYPLHRALTKRLSRHFTVTKEPRK